MERSALETRHYDPDGRTYVPGARLSMRVAVAAVALRFPFKMPGQHFELGDLPLLLLFHMHTRRIQAANKRVAERERDVLEERS